MVRATTAWEILDGHTAPTKMSPGAIDFESTLEDWIEKHPDVLEPGLVVLARQLQTVGGPLDLLCLDSAGRLVVVELKRENAYRTALAQALDYVACIAELTYEGLAQVVDDNKRKRGESLTLKEILSEVLSNDAEDWTPDAADPRIVLVGTGADASLRRIVDYFSTRYDVPINGVFFDVFASSAGTVLVRTAVVEDEQAVQQGRRRGRGGLTHEHLLALADERGVRAIVEPILEAWKDATGRLGRPERKHKCWSLGGRADGRAVPAWVFPYDDDPARKRAWLRIAADKLAADTEMDQAEIVTSLTAAQLSIDSEGWIELTEKSAPLAAEWIAKTIRAPSKS